MIGQCALFNLHPVAHRMELGITIGDQAYWGKGYGREAVQLLVDYGFRHHNLHRIYLEVHARNERAIRAYRSCGFAEEGRLRQHVWSDGSYDDLVIMGVLRDVSGKVVSPRLRKSPDTGQADRRAQGWVALSAGDFRSLLSRGGTHD